MIDRVETENNLISALNSTRITDDNELLAFRKMLSEKTQARQVTRHGYVGDGQDLGFDIDPELLERLSQMGGSEKKFGRSF